MDWSNIGTGSLILFGAGVMLFSVLRTRDILSLLKQNRSASSWRGLLFLMVFFLIGYLASTMLVLTGRNDLVLVLTGVVFFFGALFVYFVVQLGHGTIQDLLSQAATISKMALEERATREELRGSEERLKLITENAADLIAVVDKDGKRVYNSPSYEMVLGYSPDELLGTLSFNEIMPEDRERVQAAARQSTTTGAGTRIQYRMRHKDGSTRLLESISSPVHDANGEIDSYVLIARDITQRGETYRAEALHQQNEYLAALHETTLGLVARLDSSELLQAVVTRAASLVGTLHGYVFLHEPGAPDMEMRVGIGAYGGFVGSRTKPGVGLAGAVWATGQPLAVDDYASWGQRLRDPSRDVLRAVIGVPIKSGEEVIGVIGLAYLEEGRKFGSAQVDVLTRFSQLASVALDNAKLYATAQKELAERKRAEETLRSTQQFLDRQNAYLTALHETSVALMQHLETQDLLQNIVSRAGSLLGTEHGYIYLQDAGSDRADMRVGVGVYAQLVGAQLSPGVGLAGAVWQTGQPLAVEDYRTWSDRLPYAGRDALRAVVGVPVKSGDRTIGVIGLAFVEENRQFGPAEIDLLTRFADLVSIALENAHLFEQTQVALVESRKTADREARIAEISDQIYKTTDVQSVLRIAAEELRRATGGSRAVIRLGRPDVAN